LDLIFASRTRGDTEANVESAAREQGSRKLDTARTIMELGGGEARRHSWKNKAIPSLVE